MNGFKQGILSGSWRTVLGLAAVTAALAAVPAGAQQPAGGYAPGARVLLDAHNAYPTEGGFADRIDRALATGLPLAIEQDLFWFTDPRSGVGRSVVAHVPEEAATAPSFEEYFFAKVAPIVEKAIKENRRAAWPLITLNLDFKSNEPEHHAAVWALLGKYEAWLTTAERTARADVPAPLTVGPMLVLTGSNPLQQTAFHDNVPVGQRLRLFGATMEPKVPGANAEERAKNYSAVPVDAAIQYSASNYRRWANFPWAVVEAGGQTAAGEWTDADRERLDALVARAHALHLWIRFYTLNGHAKDQGQGWTASYNFGSEAAAALRWRAALEAGVDFIATDQYEAFARVKKSRQ
jgi:hypothetical protein